MMGRTHKAGGCLAMLAVYTYLHSKGFMPEVHPFVQLLLMYPAASWGSTMPDLDQSENSIPEKTPFSMLINKMLYMGKVKHRSWQTHSLLMMGLFLGILFGLVYGAMRFSWFGLDTMSCNVLLLLVTGLSVGIGSHLLLDLMTYEGIQLVPGVWLRFFRLDMFKTGTTYEKVVRFILYVGCVLMFGYLCFSVAGVI